MPGATAHQHLATLNDGRHLVRLVCEAESVEIEGSQWCQILPAGPFVPAIDGRAFVVSEPEKVLARSKVPMLVDWEHQSESFLGSTRAAGWIEELFFETGSARFPRPGLWGRTNWTPDGKKDVDTKAFRYLSPVVLLDPDTREAQEIASVALTNRPALEMQSLESYRERLSAKFGEFKQGDGCMKPENLKLLLSALGLTEGVSEVDIVTTARAAFSSRELLSAAQAELSTLRTRLTTLEGEKATTEKAVFEAEVKTTIEQGAREGRIVPAAVKGYESFCMKSKENLQLFKETILPTLPILGEPAPKTTPIVNPAPSTDEDKALVKAGFSAKEIEDARKHIADARAQREG